MGSYKFVQFCRPQGDFRVKRLIEFFTMMKGPFHFSDLYDVNSKPIELTTPFLEQRLKKETSKHFPYIGATVHFFTIPPRKRDDNTVRFEIHTGTQPDNIFMDNYDIQIGDTRKVPDFSCFRESIKLFRPFDAYLSEGDNEIQLNAHERRQSVPKFDRPTMIRGFHYLDEGMADSIGGIDYCLKAPAWNVERFCEGVLIQLVDGLFDSGNPDHLRVQEKTMLYFGL